MPVVAGLDGCRGGWMMVRLDTTNRQISVDFAPTWQTLDFSGLALAAVDMPIGLADRGPRACDLAARKALSPKRGSSVFPTPCRQTLSAKSYEDALSINRRILGRGLTKQSWAIAPKIREVD